MKKISIGPRSIFGDGRFPEIGTLEWWLKDKEIKGNYIFLNCPCLSYQYEKYDFSLIEDKNCTIVINDAMEGSSWLPQEITNFTLYLRVCGVDPKRVLLITQNYNYAYEEFPFQVVHWNLMESFYRVRAKEWIDYNDDAKKFLCLNRWARPFRLEFMKRMEGILDQFNYSLPDKAYDRGNLEKNLMMGGGLYWDFPEHKRDSLLYIVTESSFEGEHEHLRDVSEKTWRPIALQMPFILLHEPFALRRLRDIGYRTFHTIWDESYDTIVDPEKRMDAIVNLVLELNSRENFRGMIDSCRDIVEHNFAMLKMRRPEENWISLIR